MAKIHQIRSNLYKALNIVNIVYIHKLKEFLSKVGVPGTLSFKTIVTDEETRELSGVQFSAHALDTRYNYILFSPDFIRDIVIGTESHVFTKELNEKPTLSKLIQRFLQDYNDAFSSLIPLEPQFNKWVRTHSPYDQPTIISKFTFRSTYHDVNSYMYITLAPSCIPTLESIVAARTHRKSGLIGPKIGLDDAS